MEVRKLGNEVELATEFVARTYVESGLLHQDSASRIIQDRLTRPGRIVFVAGDPVQAVACLVVRHKCARVTCLASQSHIAVASLFYAIGEELLQREIVSLKAKVHPKYTKFYTKIIGAEVSTKVRSVESVGGAEGVTIRLTIDKERLSQIHSWKRKLT